MAGRDDAADDPSAYAARRRADVIGELSLLRERAAGARQASRAISAAAQQLCEVSETTCEVARRNRDQWGAWRRGIAESRARTGVGWSRPTVRVCHSCESVCFAQVGADDAGPNASEPWIEPPNFVKRTLAAGLMCVAVTSTLCPRCAPALRFDDAIDQVDAEPVIVAAPAALSHEVAAVLLTLLDDVAVAVEQIVGESPALDVEQAFDLAFAATIERLKHALPPDELRDLAAALRALVVELRHGSPTPFHQPPERRSSVHFRPRLGRR